MINRTPKFYPSRARPLKISIVITTFNRANCVSDAIDSALYFFHGSDVILVDDASSDGTVEYISFKYAKEINCKQLKFLKLEKNLGVTGAKNIGYIESQSDWVIFLDSDDTLVSENSSIAFETLNNFRDVPIIFFRCKNTSGTLVGVPFKKNLKIGISDYLEHTSYGEALTAVNKSLVLCQTPYLESLRGYEGLGCSRIIRDHGAALLSKTILRVYNENSVDNLSRTGSIIRRSNQLMLGHSMMLKEFYAYMPGLLPLRFIIKILGYYFLSLIPKIFLQK